MTVAQIATKTIRLKVRPSAYAWLDKAAVEVNQVWNWANATSAKAARPFVGAPRWLSGYDLNNLSAGATEYFEHIGADTVQCINVEYAAKRKAAKRVKLRWRKSRGAKRSLGWVPFKAANIKRKGNAVRFSGKSFPVYQSERLDGVKFRQGCFAQDACGTWWLCIAVTVQVAEVPAPEWAVGIDPGIKDAAVTSDGDRLRGNHYRDAEHKIALAQKRGHKRQAKLIHRRIKNRRNHQMNEFTRRTVDQYQNIFIDNVSSTKMVKTRMAKGALDASWAKLKAQLQYKGQQAGRRVEVVNEAFTTRACSQCGSLSGPQGLRQLFVRAWRCSECETEHDRDINSAINIRQLGLMREPPSAGTRLPPSSAVLNSAQEVAA